MKGIKNMKKWFIALAALMLLLIPSVTIAEDAKEVTFFCIICHENRTGTLSDTYEYSDSTYHVQRIICKTCGYRGMTISSRHTESRAATCQSAAYCDVCKSNYGAPAEHNWGPWTKADENQHVRTCQNSGCNQTQSGEHTGGNATCTTAGTCAICFSPYKDSDNHVGPYTYSYESSPSSATQHTVTETCTGCGKISRIYDEDHQLDPHDGKAPTCMESGWEAYQTCKYCTYTTYSALNSDPDAHIGTATTTYAKTSETQHTPTTTYSDCPHSVEGSPEDHTETTAATCTAAAYCAVCESYYGKVDPDAHDLESHGAQAPTCTEIGWEAYQTCTREGCAYTTYREIPALGHDGVAKKTTPATCTAEGYTTYTCTRCGDSYRDDVVPALQHWYAEWTPNGDATHAAHCKRDCDKIGSADCAAVACAVLTGEVRTEFTLCPVCGEIRQAVAIGEERIPLNDAQLLLVDAAAEALTERLPAGEIVVRMGELESGELLMSVAFEISGELTQPTGQVKITLPAEALSGHTLAIIEEDGTEAPIELEIEEDTAAFTLDFTESQTPVALLRLLPQA